MRQARSGTILPFCAAPLLSLYGTERRLSHLTFRSQVLKGTARTRILRCWTNARPALLAGLYNAILDGYNFLEVYDLRALDLGSARPGAAQSTAQKLRFLYRWCKPPPSREFHICNKEFGHIIFTINKQYINYLAVAGRTPSPLSLNGYPGRRIFVRERRAGHAGSAGPRRQMTRAGIDTRSQVWFPYVNRKMHAPR